ncbi:class I SAM-dependent methyltransferase [Streptomyces sp. NPDC097619]|uniref:class I SAM-dependent methyltransferase n=1 Tax=Streptomyces sp. NPDC097619 TaxID=3157228 RepID=UPI003317E487
MRERDTARRDGGHPEAAGAGAPGGGSPGQEAGDPGDGTMGAAELFDEVGLDYERAFGAVPGQLAALDWLSARLRPGARVLDVGSGTGRPTAARLSAAGFAVTGIDVSAAMTALARRQVPGARFEQVDVRDHRAEPGSFEAVCAFFPLLMMSRRDAVAALRRMSDWLAPGGYLVSATVPADVADLRIAWMGRPVRVSSFAAPEYVRLVREECGLEVLHEEVALFRPAGDGAEPEEHVFCYARKGGRAPESDAR